VRQITAVREAGERSGIAANLFEWENHEGQINIGTHHIQIT
jgi:hypothetical protein